MRRVVVRLERNFFAHLASPKLTMRRPCAFREPAGRPGHRAGCTRSFQLPCSHSTRRRPTTSNGRPCHSPRVPIWTYGLKIGRQRSTITPINSGSTHAQDDHRLAVRADCEDRGRGKIDRRSALRAQSRRRADIVALLVLHRGSIMPLSVRRFKDRPSRR